MTIMCHVILIDHIIYFTVNDINLDGVNKMNKLYKN